MPALPNVSQVVRLDFIHSDGSDLDILSRNFWAYTGTPPTDANLNSFCTDAGEAWGADLKAYANDGLTLVSVTATDLSSPTSAIGEASVGTTGTRGTEVVPADVAAVISYEIGRRYRGGHPRGYWPFGVSTDLQTVQTWTSTFTSDLTTSFESFVGAIAASGWAGAGSIDQVNVSYFEGFVAVENPITHRYRNIPTPRVTPLQDLVRAWEARTRVGSQRRRLGKS